MRAPSRDRALAAAVSLFLLLLAGGCGDNKGPASGNPKTPETESPAPGEEGGAARDAAAPAPGVRLAGEPRIDLLDNRYRWHLYREGLLLPFAGEGFRKYTQEYRRPWGPVVQHDGRPGRVLGRRVAFLRVPWEGEGAATARLWAHGAAGGQRVQIDVNGERAGEVALPDAWKEIALPIEAGMLRPGENEIRLYVARRGRAGGARTWGLYHALELVPGEAEPAGTWPPLSPAVEREVGGEGRAALAGFPRMAIYVEVPPEAWLRVHLGSRSGEARFRIRARGVRGEPALLLDETPEAGAWAPQRVSLEDFAGRLVVLELALTGEGGAWGAPRIALEEAEVRERPGPYQNVLLVVVDALRSDRLSLYGETRVSTPRMTGEAEKRGVVFLRNQAASPSSPPSHGSIQTGMIPRVHGVVGDKARLDPGTPMISTQLGEAGVATAYYGNNPFGMARLEEPGAWTAFHQPNQEGKGIDCTVLVEEMIGFARRQSSSGTRFFISSLPYEPHTPYRYHQGVSDRFWDGPWGPPVGKSVDGYLLSDLSTGKKSLTEDQWKQLRALYDGEVEHMDGCFGRLVDGMRELGVAGETAIVLTSDHGEGMFEHGKMGHAFGHYAELADVPLVVYADGLVGEGPRKIETVTSHRDIAPTVLDLMGVEASERIQGRSLLPLALRQGPWTPRVVSLEYGRSYALRARRWKLIVGYGGEESLFDLQEDPTEQKDLIGERPVALRYLRDLAGFFLEHRKAWKMSSWGPLNNHRRAFVDYIEEK